MEKIKKFFGKDGKWMDNKTFLKILSVALAIILWSYVTVTQDPSRTDRVENVKVEYGLNQHQTDMGLSVISTSTGSITFEATGKRSLVSDSKKFSSKLDLEDISAPGKYNITPEILRPDGVYINDVTPSTIEVYVDKYVSSTMPVIIETKGKLSDNVIINEMVTDITQTQVNLPSMALGQISYIGAIVDLSDITSSAVINCEPVLFDSEKNIIDLNNIVIDTKNIVVSISAEQIKSIKITPKITNIEKFAKGFTITVAPKTIDLCGQKELLDKIAIVETREIVLSRQVKESEVIQAELILPEGTRLKNNDEKTVKLIFNK